LDNFVKTTIGVDIVSQSNSRKALSPAYPTFNDAQKVLVESGKTDTYHFAKDKVSNQQHMEERQHFVKKGAVSDRDPVTQKRLVTDISKGNITEGVNQSGQTKNVDSSIATVESSKNFSEAYDAHRNAKGENNVGTSQESQQNVSVRLNLGEVEEQSGYLSSSFLGKAATSEHVNKNVTATRISEFIYKLPVQNKSPNIKTVKLSKPVSPPKPSTGVVNVSISKHETITTEYKIDPQRADDTETRTTQRRLDRISRPAAAAAPRGSIADAIALFENKQHVCSNEHHANTPINVQPAVKPFTRARDSSISELSAEHFNDTQQQLHAAKAQPPIEM